MAARGEAQADVEVSTLVVPAWRLRWRAPELALVLGERAVALASTRRDEIDRLRAESLVIFAGNRMGRGVRIADRALDALRASDKAGEQETSWRLRIELAACATAVGAPLTGFGAVRPVLAAEGVPLAVRAAALVQASDCLVTIGRGPQLGMALSEADQLYVADTLVDADTRLLQRGLLHASAAAQHRRWGDLQAATDAAGKGLELLAKLGDPTVDSGQVRAKLTLELVCALMDSNRLGEASEVGSPLLDLPVRAPSAGDVGWLRLALATRVHLPAGRVDLARGMLRDAADSAQRHQLDTLLAESLLALAHVHEVSGDLAEALTDLRSAHAAERRRARAVYAVRARLAAEFSGAPRQPVGPHEQLGSLLRPGDGRTSSAQGAMRGSQPPADAVLAPELKQQLRQWRPAPPPKQEGVRIKRSLRAAEDMTVEGISAARAHAADRWRLVQPFGATAPDTTDPAAEPSAGGRRRAEDRDTAATELPTTSEQGAETAVPATGLIAAAGAMRSGRRRAARDAADDDTSTGTPSAHPPAPTVPSAPWTSGRPAPEPRNDQSDTTPEVANVLDTLKAAGLMDKHRSGGRRRAPDAENDQSGPQRPADSSPTSGRSDSRYEPSQPADSSSPLSEAGRQAEQPAPETPKWRVEPPLRLRSEDDQPKPSPSDLFDAPTTVQPAVGADGLPVERPSTGLSAAFVTGPVIPTAPALQSPSAVEPQRSFESPRSAHQTTSDDHPADAPHIGPDFHLGADSLGRSGFRPASHQPPAPGAFPADPAPHSRNTEPADSQNPPSPDFRLSADSFGRDGFRTAGPGADPAPATPPDWPPAPGSGTSPQGSPDWAHRGTPDHGASLDLTRGTGSRTPSGTEPEAPTDFQSSAQPADWSADADQGRGSDGASDSGHQPDPALGAEPRTPDRAVEAAGHRADPGPHSPDWAANDSTETGGTGTSGWPNPAHESGSPAQGWAAGGSRSAEWTSGVPRSTDGYPDTGHGGSRSSEPDTGIDAGHQSAHGLGSEPGFGDSPNWATSSPTTPRSDTPGSQTRPGSTPDTRHQGAETDPQHAAGNEDGLGWPDHGLGHHEPGRPSSADYTSEFDSEPPSRTSASDAPGWASGASPDWAPGFASIGTGDTGAYPGTGSDYSFDTDYSHVRVPDSPTVPQLPNDSTPDHEPDQVPAVPEPDQIPPIPDPDPIPQPAPIPMPPTSSGFDLGRSRFLTSADVEDDLPELPRRVPAESPPVEPPDLFVTAVVVGDRTIEVPSAARASRRHKSDLSLAELLTEALVAYETGRRSDPDADGTASDEIADWISSAETPVSPISPDRLERAGHHVAEPERPPLRESGANRRPSAEPTDSEKTTYLTPVRDVESTAPIWETGPDGDSLPPYDSWTLPES